MKNIFVWVDIPVHDLERAVRFYSAVVGEEVGLMDYSGFRFGLFPHSDTSVSGCLLTPGDAAHAPSSGGPLVYVNVQGRMDAAIKAAQSQGGEVLEPLKQIGQHGFRAIVRDSEGNRIALHAQTLTDQAMPDQLPSSLS